MEELDQDTKQFLIGTFTDTAAKRSVTFRQLAQQVIYASRLKGPSCSSAGDDMLTSWDGELLRELDKVGSLQEFDIFRVQQLSTTLGPLQHVSIKVFTCRDYVQMFSLDPSKLAEFLWHMEKQYWADNPYHNSLHAADVVQGIHMLMQGQRGDYFNEIEGIGAILAAIGHDVDHPGVTNTFRVAMRDQASLIYNDISVNENVHASCLYRTLSKQGCEVLGHLTKAQGWPFARWS